MICFAAFDTESFQFCEYEPDFVGYDARIAGIGRARIRFFRNPILAGYSDGQAFVELLRTADILR
jgi:hypothetical protein